LPEKTSRKSAKGAEKAAAERVVAKAAKPRKAAPKSQSRKVAKPSLLAGGNPQIAKADGDAPGAGPHRGHAGLERRRRAPPRRAHRADRPRRAQGVKWNSPLYGVEGQGWFLGIHCFRRTNVSGQRRSQPDPISRPTLVADPDTTRDPIEAVGEDTRVTGERQQP